MSSLFIKNVNILNPFSDEILDERNVFIKGNKIESVGVNETTLVGTISWRMAFTRRKP